MKIAVSGHRELDAATSQLVDVAVREHLQANAHQLVGISCLADGADQIFARAAIDVGGDLVAIIPAEQYRVGLPEHAHAAYDQLLVLASDVHHLPYVESNSEAHMAASRLMLELADALVAVWDGQPARGYGGTADVVDLARSRGLDVTVIWPDGAMR